MFLELATVGTFVLLSLLAYLVGETLLRSRAAARLTTRSGAAKSTRKSGRLKRALAGLVPQFQGEVDSIQRDLMRAGYYGSTAFVDYMATRNVLIVAIAVTTGVLAVLADPATSLPQQILAAGALIAVICYGLPRLLLHGQANRRVSRIHRGLPDALDIVRMCLTAGLPLRDSFQRVGQEIMDFHPDIAVEFEVVRRHADAATMPNALKQFARRIDTPDVNALASIVSQSERIGAQVAKAVADFADSIRLSQRHRADERANKTSIKMLFPIVLCLAPPIYILLCGPPVLKLRNFVTEGNRPGGILESPQQIDNSGESIFPEPSR